jgi:hypothetical protein
VLAGIVALAVLAAPSARAEDKPFAITFDQHQVKIGVIPDIPIGAMSTGGSITGTVDETGKVTIPAKDFVFPIYGLEDPVAVSAYMSTTTPATGTWDEETGALTLDAKAGIFLKLNVGQTLELLGGLGIDLGDQLGALGSFLNGNLACGFSPMDVTFSTESAGGARFAKGTLGAGAISAEWSQLGKFAGQTGVGFSTLACPLIKSQLPTLLEGVLGGTGTELPIDLGELDLASLLTNLDDLDLGPSSIVLSRTVDETQPPIEEPPIEEPEVKSPNLKLSVTPKKRKVRTGKKAVFTVKVKNLGNGSANGVKVCLRSPGKKVLKGQRCRVLGSVAAGSTSTRKFQVKVKKGKKKKSYKVGFELRAANATRSKASTRLLIRRG